TPRSPAAWFRRPATRPPEILPMALLYWLRRLAENRFRASSRRPARRALPEVEQLESRLCLTTATWTGADVPDILGAAGNITTPGNPRWSDAKNWLNGVVPQDNFDVVFPTTVSAADKKAPKAFKPINSFNDLGGLTLNTLTVQDKDFVIGGNALTLRSTLLADANFTSGSSEIDLPISLEGNPQSIEVDNPGATLIVNSDL